MVEKGMRFKDTETGVTHEIVTLTDWEVWLRCDCNTRMTFCSMMIFKQLVKYGVYKEVANGGAVGSS